MAVLQVRQSPIQGPNIGANDRLGLTIFFAIILHSLIILGISFSKPDKKKPPEKLPGLEVTLVQSRTDKKIEDADFLAQANQEGGGDSQEANRPTSAVEPQVATGEMGEVAELVPETLLPQFTEQTKMQLMTVDDSEVFADSQTNTPEMPTNIQNPTAAQLIMLNKKIAKQSAEVDLQREKYSRRTKTKIITAKTREYRFASYEEAWRKKVERIGTLNFPDEARRRKLSGNVRVKVTIRSNGTVKKVDILSYSGHKILDDAVVRIVKMASPYPRFSEEIRQDTDEIAIIRTWQFLAGSKFKTK